MSYTDDIASLDRLEHYSNVRHQWKKGHEAIVRSGQNYNCQPRSDQILLILKILITCHEGIEDGLRQLKQSTVFGARPTHFRYGRDLMLGQFTLQLSW